MTESRAWREFESGDGVLLKLLRFALTLGIFFSLSLPEFSN